MLLMDISRNFYLVQEKKVGVRFSKIKNFCRKEYDSEKTELNVLELDHFILKEEAPSFQKVNSKKPDQRSNENELESEKIMNSFLPKEWRGKLIDSFY
jgi:hypothetical protein